MSKWMQEKEYQMCLSASAKAKRMLLHLSTGITHTIDGAQILGDVFDSRSMREIYIDD